MRVGFRRGGASVVAEGGVKLRALSARYDETEHKQYLDRLLEVVDGDDDSVRNIALTGRYGAGKSSVLVQLKKKREDRVLFLSLSTMGRTEKDTPTTDGTGAEAVAAKAAQTNDIEKELVKQLLHREPARKLPLSRYRRISSPGLVRAARVAALQVAAIATALWMLDAVPDIRGLSSDEDGWNGLKRMAAAGLAFVLGTAALTWVRLVIYDKAISAISAGGASISLSEKNQAESYFDRYLDEIVYYFQRFKKIDIVVFEDLDRFDNPQIFEELRELNELLNNSREMKRTIRFVYALRDSIFEKLGHDETTAALGDDARAEVVRANRTKFFDLVIPMVPFITPRTSRSLLKNLLAEEPAPPPVKAEVRDLVAKHITDMRLLTNIRNEYAVFSHRLITEKKGAPALRNESLFALMVYKNIQLSDYEDLLLGRSALDTLYVEFVSIVTETTRFKRARLRDLDDSLALSQALPERAPNYGGRLRWLLRALVASAHTYGDSSTITEVQVAGKPFLDAGLESDEFWRNLLTEQGEVVASFSHRNYGMPDVTLSFEQICEFLGEDLTIGAWDERARTTVQAERKRLEADLELLHRADFKDLASRSDFTRNKDGKTENFGTILLRAVRSEVCRDLVRNGFIDQNFAVYVSQFYGDLVTVRAMNFVVQHVQRNNAYPDYEFPGDADVVGVFDEVGYDFLDQVSGYNIAILDYLMRTDRTNAIRIIDRIINLAGEIDFDFLDTYLTNGKQALELVSILASKWPATFTHLTTHATVSNDRRCELVNEALRCADDQVTYDLDDEVREYLRLRYSSLSVFTNAAQDPAHAQAAANTVALLARADFRCDDLSKVSPEICERLVEADLYLLSAKNLHTALGDTAADPSHPHAAPKPLGLDRIRGENEDVYRDCLAAPDTYLHIVTDDAPTTTAILSDPGTFLDIINDLASWETEYIVAGLALVPHEWRIETLDETTLSSATWPALARTGRFPLTFANFKAYVDHFGGIDSELAAHLARTSIFTGPPAPSAATAEAPNSDDGDAVVVASAVDAAVLVLSAKDEIGDAAARVKLATSLDPGPLAVGAIAPEPGELLGLLLDAGIVEDAEETFARFAPLDSATFAHAAEHSSNLSVFISPQWVGEDLIAVLNSDKVSDATHETILQRFGEFIPAERAACSPRPGARSSSASL